MSRIYNIIELSRITGIDRQTLQRLESTDGTTTRISNESLLTLKKTLFNSFIKWADKIDNRVEMRNKSKPKQWIVSLDLDNGERWLDTIIASDHVQAFSIARNSVDSKVVSSQIKQKT